MSGVVVIGAGVLGASVAYHLARRGALVTVLDKAAAPAQGVTGASFAWIGGCSGTATADPTGWPGGAADLCESVLDDHRRLEGELPALAIRWTGSLSWAEAAPPLAPGQQLVGRSEIAALEPHLREAPARAVLTAADGGVDPVHLTETLLAGARALGARVILQSEVTSLKVRDGQIDVVTSSASYRPSTVVLAAGTAVAALSEPLNVLLPVTSSPAVRLRVATRPGLVRTIVVTPDFEAREVCDGQVLMTLPGRGGSSEKELRGQAQQGVEKLRAAFRDADDAELLEYDVGMRPMPVAGPIVGPLWQGSAVYVTVAHSAITLAPTIGRLVAREIDTGEAVPRLSRCRPPAHL